MAELSPEEWAYWQASYRCDPWGDDWERSSTETVELINAMNCLAHAMGGGKGEPPAAIPYDALVPFRERKDEVLEESLQAVSVLEDQRGL